MQRLANIATGRWGAEDDNQVVADPLAERASATTAAPIIVSPVKSGRDRHDFVKVPWRIFQDDPHWVPPLLVEHKEFIRQDKHPFHLHGASTAMVARRGGEAVGCILVSDDPRYNEQHQSNVGCFGMFDCIDDRQVAAALLDAAAAWLRARGRTTMMGPIDYSTNYPCGLLIEGFDTPPRVMMNHHRPYYARLLETWGLTKAKDLYAWWFNDSEDMLNKWGKRAQRLAKRGGITIRPLRRDDFNAEVARCMDVYNETWSKSWGFVKMTEAEVFHMARQLRRLAVLDLMLLAEVDGQPVGFSMTLPDFNEALRPLNGRLTTFGLPIGLARFAFNLRRVKTARVAVLGVREQYRRRGIIELLILRTLDYGKNVMGYSCAELGWTLEDNDLMNRAIEKVGAKHYKTYRIYEAPL